MSFNRLFYITILLSLSFVVSSGAKEVVDTADYVNWQKENWRNKEDLSFIYEMTVRDGVLHLTVEVLDDTVVLKEGDSIVSDHIELCLFDPQYANVIKNDMAELRQFIDERKSLSFSNEISEYVEKEKVVESNNDMIRECEEQIQEYKKLGVAVQYIFNKNCVSSYPSGWSVEGIDCTYSQTDTGYTCTIRVPLQFRFDVCHQTLEKLGYLVSVVDIDDEDATEQQKMISSKIGAKYGKPSTFNVMELDNPLVLDIPEQAIQIAKLEPDGIFRAVNSKYEYFTKRMVPLAGFFGVDRHLIPGAFTKAEFCQIADEPLVISYYNEIIRFEENDNVQYLSLGKYSSAARVFEVHSLDVQHKDDTYYVLLRANGPSRWPGGSTHCGAGEECDLILIELDSELQCSTISSELICSCWKNIYAESVEEDEKKIIVTFEDSSSVDQEWVIEYSKMNPEKGLTKTTLKIGQ